MTHLCHDNLILLFPVTLTAGYFLVTEVNKNHLKLPGTTTLHVITYACTRRTQGQTHEHGRDLENHTLKSLMESMSSGKRGSWKKKK